MDRRCFALVVLGAALGAWPGPAAAAPSPADVALDQVQAYYAKVGDLTATFRQPYMVFGMFAVIEGTLAVRKPDKMRWDYRSREGTPSLSVVFDGATRSDVDHGGLRVTQDASGDDVMTAALAFLYGEASLSKTFTAAVDASGTFGDAKADLVLRLVPRQPSARYKAVYLVVARTDHHVKQSIVIGASDNVNQFIFSAIDPAAKLADDAFKVDQAAYPTYRFTRLAPSQPATTPAKSTH